MGSIAVAEVISNLDAGDFKVAVVLKDGAGNVIATSPDSATVTVPPPSDVPVLPPPDATVGP